MKDPFYTYGFPELCSLQVTKDGRDRASFWIQTSSRVFARKLRKRKDTSLVASSVTKRFLETYWMQGSWRKIRRLIDRYISSTGDTFSDASTSQNALASAGRVDIASPQPATPDHFYHYDASVRHPRFHVYRTSRSPTLKRAGAQVVNTLDENIAHLFTNNGSRISGRGMAGVANSRAFWPFYTRPQDDRPTPLIINSLTGLYYCPGVRSTGLTGDVYCY